MYDNPEKYQKLKDKKYLVIPNFISQEEVTWYLDYFNRYVEQFKIGNDSMVENCSSKYNFVPFVQLLCYKTEIVSSIVGANLLPTYAFGRTYYKNSDLKKHKDRPACEVSLSVHLEGDKEWNLFIEGCPVTLNEGDAVLYWGYDDEHWRDKYEGEKYTNVFLHYVRTFGPFCNHVFDIKNYAPKTKKHFLST